ncbi:hypothetical protein LTR78_001945 [Recurvomyces mirabilis]|uniref:Uncharacterized protein n=1 Tax=Recurvomyces mirabilis TaxID=574656 RepID=A0AAE0WU55_9PEZI|nr:hypothetical protein LTR78_001945 [Recurvomyces mirabilis]KAK5160403.1 hypothetical protein LTS14_001415 [Recurvomyces mirabilis]
MAAPAANQRTMVDVTETSPLFPGSLAIPSNRWVVRSYGAIQSRDIVCVASRLEALTPPPSPSSESSSGARLPGTVEMERDTSAPAQQELDLEAGRARQDDEKSEEMDAQSAGREDSDTAHPGAGRTYNLCKLALFVLLVAFYTFMLVMALRERYGFV